MAPVLDIEIQVKDKTGYSYRLMGAQGNEVAMLSTVGRGISTLLS